MTETCNNCRRDCGQCTECGDGLCQRDEGEDCVTCTPDCGPCETCGDGTCSDTEDCFTCPSDCGQCPGCGDFMCTGNEDCASCPTDCGTCAVCGNDRCETMADEDCANCPSDCGMCNSTCREILFQCVPQCFGPFDPICLGSCTSMACPDVRFFLRQVSDCAIQKFQDGTCSDFQCVLQECQGPIQACLAARCTNMN
jgi:hypothetical protein